MGRQQRQMVAQTLLQVWMASRRRRKERRTGKQERPQQKAEAKEKPALMPRHLRKSRRKKAKLRHHKPTRRVAKNDHSGACWEGERSNTRLAAATGQLGTRRRTYLTFATLACRTLWRGW